MNEPSQTLVNAYLCGDIDIRIDRDGGWHHEGRPIARPELSALFASVLKRDDSGDYWLVTPVEKARIQVEDVPFVAVSMEVDGVGQDQTIRFRTSIGDEFTLDEDHSLSFRPRPGNGDRAPYVNVRDGLLARLSRPVYYELVEYAVKQTVKEGVEQTAAEDHIFGVWSAGSFFRISEDGDDDGIIENTTGGDD